MNRIKQLPQLKSWWMLIAASCFALMGTFVKLGSATFSSSELVFYRSLFGLILLWSVIIQQNKSIKTTRISNHLFRSITGFLSLLLFFYAISQLPLATAMTLNYTSALFLALLSPSLLKEKTHRLSYLALFFGFVGVSILLNPSLDQQNIAGYLAGITSGFGAALAYIGVRRLGKLNEPDWRTVFYFTLISTIGAGSWMLFDQIHIPQSNDLFILLGLGLSATIAQLALTRAYRTGDTLTVACLGYCTPILASLIGLFLWQETLNTRDWLAIGLIIASGVANAIINNLKTDS